MSRVCKVKSAYASKFKIAVIGCGNVGATAAYAMLIDGTPSEMMLIDIDKKRAEGLSLDFVHSLPFWQYTKIGFSDSYADCKDADLVVITAGARQKEGETRLDLVEKNKAIFDDIIPKIVSAAPNAILLIVSNPVDVLTYHAQKISGLPRNRVFGSGTMLDTARFQYHISERLCLSPRSIDAYVLGEHGDSSFPVFGSANVAGKPLLDFEGFNKEVAMECYEETRQAAYRIINDIGFTSYSIGMVIREIMLAIYSHARIVVPLSVVLDDYYGHSDVALSVPCVLDSDGVSEVIHVPLNEEEQRGLRKSVETLRQYL
ncbi:L-lactate dehydrogenase [Candidatus Peregrinibacteria bacterium]|nr:L-lactate dehydrogenase [Candidatus Peregrinibacteria bacterium]